MERVLSNTTALLHELNVTPKSESQIYDAVCGILKLIFPSASDAPKGKFAKVFKKYEPDIVVPELSAAIEYKFINSEQDLRSLLGQIADDVQGYTGNPQYKLFYAVIYLTRDVGLERCELAWSECHFPNHWIPIFVVGPTASGTIK